MVLQAREVSPLQWEGGGGGINTLEGGTGRCGIAIGAGGVGEAGGRAMQQACPTPPAPPRPTLMSTSPANTASLPNPPR